MHTPCGRLLDSRSGVARTAQTNARSQTHESRARTTIKRSTSRSDHDAHCAHDSCRSARRTQIDCCSTRRGQPQSPLHACDNADARSRTTAAAASTSAVATSAHSNGTAHAAVARSASSALASSSAVTLTPSTIQELSHALQAMLPLCSLSLVALAQMLSSSSSGASGASAASAAPSNHSDRAHYEPAVQAALYISRAPRAAATTAVQAAAPERTGSFTGRAVGVSAGTGGGALHKLLNGLIWILEHAPFGSMLLDPSFSTSSSTTTSTPLVHESALIMLEHLLSLLSRRDACRSASSPARSLSATCCSTLLRVLSRLSLEAWSVLEASDANASANARTRARARATLERSLRVLALLTSPEQPSAHQNQPTLLHPFVAALINKLGAIVVAGPMAAAAAAAGVTAAKANSDGDGDGGSRDSGSHFMLPLILLGNFVCHNAHANTFVKSNNTSSGSSSSSTSSSSSCSATFSVGSLAATSTSLSSIPLKGLYRQLIACLSSPTMSLVTHSLRLVAFLAVSDSASGASVVGSSATGPGTRTTPGTMEAKLFNANNTEQTLELVFNIIAQTASGGVDGGANVGSDESDGNDDGAGASATVHLLKPATHILTTLMQSHTILEVLKNFPQLPANLKQIVRILGRAAFAATASSSSSSSSSSQHQQQSNDSARAVCLPLLDLLGSLCRGLGCSFFGAHLLRGDMVVVLGEGTRRCLRYS